jgi:hypothetical protein
MPPLKTKSKNTMSFNINFLGHLPFNPDNLHTPSGVRKQKTSLIAQELPRYYGMDFNTFFTNYWTVRSYEVSITAYAIDTTDQFSSFIAGGGGAGGIIGAQVGLNNTQQSLQGGGNFTLKGHTKIYSKYSKKIRKAREGIFNNKTMFDVGGETCLNYDESVDENYLISETEKTNEGSLCSAGPVHVLNKNGIILIIDYSNVKYFKRQYWPQVAILTNLFSTAGFGNSQMYMPPGFYHPGGGQVYGSIRFPGGGLLYNENFIATDTSKAVVVDGSIKIGERCCDRFYWDGLEDESKRPNFEKCKEVCGNETEGVYRKEKSERTPKV